MEKIGLASDHAGYELKEKIKIFLEENNYKVIDYGTYSGIRCDYPDYGHALAKGLLSNEVNYGIALCGSGNGINMTLNRYKGIRAALCWKEEIALLARKHNDANVLSLPARFISETEAIQIIKTFLTNDFEGERHIERIKKIEITHKIE